MTTILLIRHGLTDYNVKQRAAGRTAGVSLNETGRAQAAAVAQRLARAPIKAIYCSPMERTVETAQAIAAALNLPIVVRPGLIETHTGEWTGQLYKDVETESGDCWRALHTHPRGTRIPGGETIDEIQERMVAEIETIRCQHPHDVVAVVSHADPIKATIAHYIGLDLNHFQRLYISPTSVSILELSEHGAALIVMNHMGDLPDLAPKPKHRKSERRNAGPKEDKMPKTVYELRPVQRITASAVGVPGQRTFYLQARTDDGLFTVVCEKQQVGALALAIDALLDEVDRRKPESAPEEPVPDSDLELEEPLEPLFRVGQLGLDFDVDSNAVIIVATEIAEEEDTDPETLSVARFWATRSQARALSRYAVAVVERGRPLCPLCGEPMDASGHICPKRNGHKKLDAT